ncbi:hypothetical protein SAMN05421819_2359 [Bryocella elongata]|uniref:Uncharacterized protein n=1 Tax=Bryocella elongata TaxID=863522 RepID=A0A1H5YLU8_9BACT|nr:hypothetical protein [Bryocella elongata]SEG24477.1 hypothetical protein SAMN05421819_2359 [Bryocella elongata]
MEVHPPHEPVHSWRDFFTHILIVTIGLFIALTLEALVESVHHRHLVAEARENLHREISDNCEASQKDIASTQTNVTTLANNITTIHALQEKVQGHHFHVENAMQWNDFSTAGWRTAHETGALGFMPYDEVQRYSDLYSAQEFIEARAESLFDRNILAMAPFKMGIDPDNFSAEDFHSLLRANAEAEVQMSALVEVVQQYHERCQAALRDSK